MTIFHLDASESLSKFPLTPIDRDWFGEEVDPAPGFAFAKDEERFHFRARRSGQATVHPSSSPGVFQAELWKHDVAEFFLAHPTNGHYLEINLSPNGGWWSCLFRAPLKPLLETNEPAPEVTAEATINDDGWDVHLSLRLSYLRETLDFGPDSRLHASFLLDTPQRCLTSAPPAPGEPNFHHPALPQPVQFA